MGASAAGNCGGNCGCNRDCGDVATYLSRPEPYAHAPSHGQGSALPNAWPPLHAWGIVNGLDEEEGGSAPSEPMAISKRWRNKDESMEFPPSPRAVSASRPAHDRKASCDERLFSGNLEPGIDQRSQHSPGCSRGEEASQAKGRGGEGDSERSSKPHPRPATPDGEDPRGSAPTVSSETPPSHAKPSPKPTAPAEGAKTSVLLLPGVTKAEYGGGSAGVTAQPAAPTAKSQSPRPGNLAPASAPAAAPASAPASAPSSSPASVPPAPAAPPAAALPSSRPTECLLISFPEASSGGLGLHPQVTPSPAPASRTQSPAPSSPLAAAASPLSSAPAAAATTAAATTAAAPAPSSPAPACAPPSSSVPATAAPCLTDLSASPRDSATGRPSAPSDPAPSPRGACVDDALNRSQATTSAAISDSGGGISESSSEENSSSQQQQQQQKLSSDEAHHPEIQRAEIHGMRLFHISSTDIRPPPAPRRALSASPVPSGSGGGSSRRGTSPKVFLIENPFPPMGPGVAGAREQACQVLSSSSQRGSSPSASPPDDERRSQTFGDIISLQDKPTLPPTAQAPKNVTPRRLSKDPSGGRKKPRGGMGTRATRADQLLLW